MIRRILVATDGSDAAEAAIKVAVELTQSLGADARLHVAAVKDYVDVPSVFAKHPPEAPDLLAEQAEQALEGAAAVASASGLPVEVHLLEGEVVQALLDCAARIDAQMLVAGFHGRNRLTRIVMGSVVGKLVRSTDLPVVVVRHA